MRHPGIGIGICGIGVGLGVFVLQAAAVKLPSMVLVALGVIAVLMVVGGFGLELISGISSATDQDLNGQGDQEKLQEVLGEAAVSLHNTAYALDRVRLRLTQFGSGFFKDDEGGRVSAELREAGKELDSFLERLKVRFGTRHEVVIAFEAADEATLAIFRALEMIKLEPEAEAEDEYARRQVFELFDEQRTEIRKQRSVFDSSRAAFLDGAQRASGPDLPSDD